jgi:hypothetical protein
MAIKALLLATITIMGSNGVPKVETTSTVLEHHSMCPKAMEQVVNHHGMQNHLFSQGKDYRKGRNGVVTLNVSCKEI